MKQETNMEIFLRYGHEKAHKEIESVLERGVSIQAEDAKWDVWANKGSLKQPCRVNSK